MVALHERVLLSLVGSNDTLPTPNISLSSTSILLRCGRGVGNFMRRQGGEILVATLRRHGSGECKDGAVIKEAAGAIRSVTLGDDCRKDFSGIGDIRPISLCSITNLIFVSAR